MTFHRPWIAASAALLVLQACGGGGSSDAGSSVAANQSGSVTTSVAISSTNQNAVARSTVGGAFSVAQVQVLGNSGGQASALYASTPGGSAGVGAIDFAIRRSVEALQGDPRRGIASATAHATAASTQTSACDFGGNVSVTLDDRDNNSVPSAGDVMTLAFAQCRDTVDESLNGTVVLSLTASQIGSSINTLAGTMAFQNAVTTFGSSTFTINGSASVTVTDGPSEFDVQLRVGSGGLTAAASAPNYSETITYEAGMAIVTKDFNSSSQLVMTLDGTFSSTSLGGRVTVQSVQPVVLQMADLYPSSGQVKVTGASGSALMLTVLNNTQLQLQLDANGDNVYESTSQMNWSSLLPQ